MPYIYRNAIDLSKQCVWHFGVVSSFHIQKLFEWYTQISNLGPPLVYDRISPNNNNYKNFTARQLQFTNTTTATTREKKKQNRKMQASKHSGSSKSIVNPRNRVLRAHAVSITNWHTHTHFLSTLCLRFGRLLWSFLQMYYTHEQTLLICCTHVWTGRPTRKRNGETTISGRVCSGYSWYNAFKRFSIWIVRISLE